MANALQNIRLNNPEEGTFVLGSNPLGVQPSCRDDSGKYCVDGYQQPIYSPMFDPRRYTAISIETIAMDDREDVAQAVNAYIKAHLKDVGNNLIAYLIGHRVGGLILHQLPQTILHLCGGKTRVLQEISYLGPWQTDWNEGALQLINSTYIATINQDRDVCPFDPTPILAGIGTAIGTIACFTAIAYGARRIYRECQRNTLPFPTENTPLNEL